MLCKSYVYADSSSSALWCFFLWISMVIGNPLLLLAERTYCQGQCSNFSISHYFEPMYVDLYVHISTQWRRFWLLSRSTTQYTRGIVSSWFDANICWSSGHLVQTQKEEDKNIAIILKFLL